MKVKLIWIGKTSDTYLQQGMEIYLKRLKHYADLEILEIPEVKGKKPLQKQKEEEETALLQKLVKSDWVILLDEKGKQYKSQEFAGMLQEKMNRSISSLTFVIGGPFGFTKKIYQKSQEQLSLSQMTFSHQMVRLFFLEQLYRGFSILRGEKYHHE